MNKSAGKPVQSNTKVQTDAMELERKRASHIMHYLMERKQEQEYSDPFELLKSMTDIINVYEPTKKPQLRDLSSEVIEIPCIMIYIGSNFGEK